MTGRRWLPFFLALLALTSPARAAVEVGATLDRERVPVGEQVVLTVTVTGEARRVSPPDLPSLPDFRVFGGGQSQRFSFVDGRASAEHSFTYYLQPEREGNFTIDPIAVRADGQVVRTPSLELEVVAAGTSPVPASPDRSDPQDESERDAFVTMSVDRDSVVVGEQVVLTFGFHRATRMSAFESPEYTPPRTEGFWREDLPPERHTTRVIRSRRYQVTEIQYALFPTRAGDLTIGEAIVRLPEDTFGSFFRRDRRQPRGPRVLRADPITVHVDPLPEPQPQDFTGTVARDLTLDATVDRRTLDEGEAVTLGLRLAGSGNLPGAAVPSLEGLEEFRVHDAGGGADSRPQGGRLQGTRLVESLLVPRTAGRVVIPSIEYTYFDTGRRDYVTLRTEPIALEVRAVEGSGGGSGVFVGGRKSEIELLARDILHIAPVPGSLSPWAGPLPHRAVFYAALGVPALAWAVSARVSRRRRELMRDPRRLRARRALERARKTLGAPGVDEHAVVGAVHGWAADRFDRAASGLTHDDVVELATRHGADPALTRELRALLDRCDAARYAPLGGTAADLVEQTRGLLARLEEQTRNA
ncbi:MAG TPA: BatD family protein [Candidatus Krumholzibacteria bacterium]|nr:BatD family protein [Candidatus Krumholzibacteria bacterium]